MGSGRAEYIIQQLNVSSAKKVATLIVVAFITYHGVLHLLYGSDSCNWLLSRGRYKGDKEWQPYGCMMHKYSQIDTRKCLRYLVFWGHHNNFIFIGDIRLRLLYDSFIEYLRSHDSIQHLSDQNKNLSTELEYVDSKLKLSVNFIYADEITPTVINQFEKWQKLDNPPSAIIASCTHSKFKDGNLTTEILTQLSKNISRLVSPMEKLIAKKSKVIWKLQDPVDPDKLPIGWRNVLNDDIDSYNQAVNSILHFTKIDQWHSSRLIVSGLMDKMVDGYKPSALALQHEIQIILNMYCNDNMNFNDGSCCSSAETHTALQIATFSVFGVCTALSFAIIVRRLLLKWRGITGQYIPLNHSGVNVIGSSVQSLLPALVSLSMIMGYFYLCDRTNYFMKENKYYSEFSFWIPVGYVFTLGLFFTEESKFTKVLHRDQTDELKGWMQIVILIYHLTGAERVLPIHMHIKVLISAYLFLSGYVHFTYIWQTGSTGLVRFMQTLFRINFITIVLCLCMNRPYQFYYFVPMISFWFCMIYFVLSIPPLITSANAESNGYQYLYLVIKIVSLLSVITILYISEVFFERIFVMRPWKALFVYLDDDIHEWWYRWKLDRYTMSFGMIFAAILLVAQKYNIYDDSNSGNLFPRRISLLLTLSGVMGIGFYITFSFMCKDRLDCEEVHSYIVFIPIVGYIILRNISGILRTRFSAFFAWFGKISLELFICQYHIWLAADRHGVLVLLPGFPTLNILITAFIFVCASHEIHRITLILQPFAVPNDWRLAIRNAIIFMLILIPIGKYDGMF